MTNVETSYFFPPQWDFDLGGPISLGNIISDPKKPQYALNEDDRQPLPPFLVNKRKPDFKITITADTVRSAGIGSSLLQLFGFSADINAERSKKLNWTIEADELLTQEINPKPTYVETCFKHTDVIRCLQDSKYHKDLYMIIGIKAASNATVGSEIGKKSLFETKLGVNLAPVIGAPLDAHISGKTSTEHGTKASFGKSDFIIGYKLRKITYLKTQRVKNMEDVTKGTVLDSDDPTVGVEKVSHFKFLRLENENIGSEEFELPAVTAHVDGDEEEEEEDFEFVLSQDG